MKTYLQMDGDRLVEYVEKRELGDLISLLASEKSTRNAIIQKSVKLERELNALKQERADFGALVDKLERELNAATAENEAMRSAVNDADSALRKCLNHLLMQPAFARNRSDIEREAEIMESVHVALGKLQPFLKP